MVEVFKTNVNNRREAQKLVMLLQDNFPGSRINFDLEDCDRILRVEAVMICVEKICELLSGKGYFIQELK